MKKIILLSSFLFISIFAFGQSVTLTPTSAGTNTEGKMWYDTPSHSFLYWNGTAATPVGGSGGVGVGWAASGTNINNTNTGNVGVGLSSPQSKIHVNTTTASKLKFTNTLTGGAITDGFDIGLEYYFAIPSFGIPASTTPIIMNRENSDIYFGTNNTNRFVIKADGTSGTLGANLFEFGVGVAGKEVNAGKIGYNAFGQNALTIIGAGTAFGDRRVYFYAEDAVVANGEIQREASGAANIVPIAYSIIDTSGAILSGTGNFTVTHPATGVYKITVNGVSNYLDVVSTANYESAPNFSSITTDVSAGISIGISQQHMDVAVCGSFPTPPYPCLVNYTHDGKFSFVAYKP